MHGSRIVIQRGGDRMVLLAPDPRMAEPAGACRLDPGSMRSKLASWRTDMTAQDQLRRAYREIAPEGGASASFEEMTARLCADVGRGSLRAYMAR